MRPKLLATLAGGLVMMGWLAATGNTVSAGEPPSRAVLSDQFVQARDDSGTVPIQFVDHRRHRHHHHHGHHHYGFSLQFGSPGYSYYEYPHYHYYPYYHRYYYPDYGYRSYYYDPYYGGRVYYRW